MLLHHSLSLSLRILPVLALLLSGCASQQKAEPEAPEPPPCWTQYLVTDEATGQIGVARNIDAGGTSPEVISQMRAVAALCQHLGRTCDDEATSEAVESGTLEGRPLYFSRYERGGYLYSYASFSEVDESAQCEFSACDIGRCDPSWLCTPGESGQNGLLGISYRATSIPDQYLKATENGLFQAEYLYGVRVTASKDVEQSQISGQNFMINIEQGDVDTGDKETIPYHVASQCRRDSTLYRHVIIADQVPKRVDLPADDLAWLVDPKHQGLDGAVGSVEKPVASGLVSDQIKLAIKRAAIQLAFEKYSNVSEETLSVIFGDSGLIQINNIQLNTQTDLKAQVLGIHFREGVGSFLKVYTWVALIE